MGGDNGYRNPGRVNMILRVDKQMMDELKLLYGIDKRKLRIPTMSFNTWIGNQLYHDVVVSRREELDRLKGLLNEIKKEV